MSLFSSFDVNASGLTAERYRMDVISENIANIDTTRTTPIQQGRLTVIHTAGKELFLRKKEPVQVFPTC